MAWSGRFRAPVELGDGTRLRTLKEAGEYLAGRFATVVESAALVGTVEDLMAAAESGAPEDIDQAEQQLRLFLMAPGRAGPGKRLTPFEQVRASIEREQAHSSPAAKAVRRVAKAARRGKAGPNPR